MITLSVLVYWFVRRDSLYCRLSYKKQKTVSTSNSFAVINKLN